MKYHYIYKTTLLCGTLAGKYYIGKHTTQANPENCGYAGSGVIVKDYFKKYGKAKGETYNIEILELNPDKVTNAEREKYWIEPNLGDPDCLNIARGGFGGGAPGHIVKEETKRKVSQKLMGHKSFIPEGYVLPEEARKKISEAMKGNHFCLGRPSPMKGRKHSEETKQKISEKEKGKIVSEETKEKISKTHSLNKKNIGRTPWNKGVSQTEETRKKISESLTGRIIPIEVVQKRAASQRGRKNTPEVIDKMRKQKESVMTPIIATKIETGEKFNFVSQAEAERELKISHCRINRVLKGENGRTQTGGYRFEYMAS